MGAADCGVRAEAAGLAADVGLSVLGVFSFSLPVALKSVWSAGSLAFLVMPKMCDEIGIQETIKSSVIVIKFFMR